MATEKRLIDARWLTSQMYLICEAFHTENIFIDAIIDEIDNAPDVDAVEVVRCKDCKHYMAEEKERCEAMRSTPYGLCLKHRCFPLAGYHEYRNEDDFCSYGERKDNETD